MRQVAGPVLPVGAYLERTSHGKINLKPRTWATDKEIIDLYWKPALGYLRLVDLRDHHVAEAIREMMKINRPLPEGERPSEMLRRMLDARADDERRYLAPGEKRRKKSAKPLSPARIARAFAVLRAAMNAAVPSKIMVSPCAGVELAPGAEGQAAGMDCAARGGVLVRAGQAHTGRLGGAAPDHGPETGNVGCAGPAAMPGHGVAACPTRAGSSTSSRRASGWPPCSAWSPTAGCAATRSSA